MWLTKTMTMVLTLALGGASLGVGLLAHQAPVAPVPRPQGNPPAALDRGKGRKESKAVTVEGVAFQAYVQGPFVAPPPGESRPVELGLRITNSTDGALTFALMDKVWLVLETEDGRVLRMIGGRDKTRAYPPVSIAAGQSYDVPRAGRLETLELRAGLRLAGTDPSGFAWRFDGLRPGTYVLSVRYEGENAGKCWPGKAVTEGVEFALVEGP
jgi:hypothetical protein